MSRTCYRPRREGTYDAVLETMEEIRKLRVKRFALTGAFAAEATNHPDAQELDEQIARLDWKLSQLCAEGGNLPKGWVLTERGHEVGMTKLLNGNRKLETLERNGLVRRVQVA